MIHNVPISHLSVMADSVLDYTIIIGLAGDLFFHFCKLCKYFIVKHIALLSVKTIRRNASGEDDLALGVEGKHSLFFVARII